MAFLKDLCLYCKGIGITRLPFVIDFSSLCSVFYSIDGIWYNTCEIDDIDDIDIQIFLLKTY